MAAFPSIFVSHGSPMLAITPGPTHSFLKGLGAALGRPRAILCLSAHWETQQPTIGTVAQPKTIHDFGGFPRSLYELQYPAPGAPDFAHGVAEVLSHKGFPCAIHSQRGLDHGAWVPLMLMYPEADIPVVQLSIQTTLGPRHHLALGQALAHLRASGVLILGSGSATHNLSEVNFDQDAPPQDWVVEFDHWLTKTLQAGHIEDLLNYRKLAPHAIPNHPTEEHLLPLFAALGAGDTPNLLHSSYTHSTLSMAVWSFS